MAATIDAPAKCELQSVIRFLQAEGRSAAEIHHRMSKVYSENFMSDGSVREWCRKFKEGWTDVHDGGHDNAWPHCANVTKDLLKKFNWEVFDHPPYSPDLAPSDFHLFRELKAWLGGQRFAANDELQDAVKTYPSSLAANFFAEGIEKLVSRYDKCLNRFGGYVEK